MIHESLTDLMVPIDTLVPLENNPRRGNIAAITASYKEFGQIKPIVVRRNPDGTATVLAGNHQLQAAKALGWTHIAAVEMDADNQRAIAFALADNRTTELGHSDNATVIELLHDIIHDYGDVMGALGWDEFEIAYYEEQAERPAPKTGGQGFIAPIINTLADAAIEKIASMVQENEETGERQIVADDKVDHRDIAVAGSTLAVPGSAPQAVVQYTLVFDSPEQQKRWYDFIRWLRSDPAYDGVTTSAKLMSFIDAHTPA